MKHDRSMHIFLISLVKLMFFENRYVTTAKRLDDRIIFNLNTVLDIFGHHICLVLLDNHMGINILPSKHPNVIRQLENFKTIQKMADTDFFGSRRYRNYGDKQYMLLHF